MKDLGKSKLCICFRNMVVLRKFIFTREVGSKVKLVG